MRRFAYWLFPTIAVAVAIFVVFFLIEINPSAPEMRGEEESRLLDPFSSDLDAEKGWIERFSFNRDKEYLYPVNEVTVVLDMDTHANTSVTRYRLSVPIRDSYELFCLRQELQHSDLPYLLDQQGDKMSVYIDSQDQSKLTSLVAKLKTYQISATLSPFNED